MLFESEARKLDRKAGNLNVCDWSVCCVALDSIVVCYVCDIVTD